MFDALTEREIEMILLWVTAPYRSSKEAGRHLGISFRTIETHRAHILKKTGLRSGVALAREWAIREVLRGLGTADDLHTVRDADGRTGPAAVASHTGGANGNLR